MVKPGESVTPCFFVSFSCFFVANRGIQDESTSVEIDEPEDWGRVERLLLQRQGGWIPACQSLGDFLRSRRLLQNTVLMRIYDYIDL
jgi:hypothetical protein